MITIEVDVLRLQGYLNELETKLTDYTRLWSDFIAPLVAGEIAEVFETEGRGEWPPVASPCMPRRRKSRIRGKRSCVATITISKQRQVPRTPGNIARFSSSEMVWGVDGGLF